MSNDPANPVKAPVRDESLHVYSIGLPLVGILVLFVLGVRGGGEVSDTGILVLVRFLSLLVLAMSIVTTIATGLSYSKLRARWAFGQTASGFMALSAGFLWSASAYGLGFCSLMVGVTLAMLLAFKELGNRSQRRQFARQVARGK